MHFNFIIDIISILSRKHLPLSHRVSLIKSFVRLKSLHRKGVVHDKNKPINFLNYSVYTDNFGDFFATFYEIFIREEYFFYNHSKVDTVIDAGANIGLATLYFKWLNPNVKIIGFEMDEDTFFYYKKNIKENNLPNIEANKFAVGSDEVEMESYGSRRATTIYKHVADSLPEKAEPGRKKTVVVKKLSNFIQKDTRFYLKMDIEGAEIDVLHELEKAGSLSSVQGMVFEFHLDEDSFVEVSTLLERNNFSVKRGKLQKNKNFMISATAK